MSGAFWSILGNVANVVAIVGIPGIFVTVAHQANRLHGRDPIEVPFHQDLVRVGEEWNWPIRCPACRSPARREDGGPKLKWSGRRITGSRWHWICEKPSCKYSQRWNRYRAG